MSAGLKHLFSPVKIHSLELKNRAVMPAMATGYGNPDSTVSDRLAEYLARRAGGGTGLIITEVCAVDPRGKGFPNEIGAWSDDFIPGLSKISRAIHREGGKCAVQLHHAGRESFSAACGGMPEAPSPIPSAILNQPCEEMSLGRIARVIDAYAKAAGRVKAAGFDAVELHGAHGYLINQLLSPFSNHRNDQYGGSEEKRSRFILEVIEAARKSVGPDFPIIIRITTDEIIFDGYDLDFMVKLAPQLVKAGADAIHASVGVYSTPGNLSIASMDTEPGFNLFRARAIREVVDVPVIGVGRINNPKMADHAIAAGDADLISFGRQHITDPDFLNKAAAGRFDDIRWCVACNQGCIERLSFEMKSSTCTFNPECGREYLEQKKTDKPRKVMVIGAGPAGLSAALAANRLGHKVRVFEMDGAPGGQLQSASRPPHKSGFMDWVEWAVRQLKKRKVRIQYNEEVTIDLIKNEKPDTVILASGAVPSVPDIPGIGGANVFDARDVLTGKVKITAPAVILGAGYVGMETADYLLSKGIPSSIIEMRPHPPVGKHTAHGYWLHKRLKDSGGKLIPGASVSRIGKNSVVYLKDFEEKSIQAGMVITALGARADNGLESILKEAGIQYKTAGDAISPRRLLEAIHEGDRAGREI